MKIRVEKWWLCEPFFFLIWPDLEVYFFDVLSSQIAYYQQVLHLHVVLGLQDILCVWFYAAGVPYPYHCNCVRHYRVHLFPS